MTLCLSSFGVELNQWFSINIRCLEGFQTHTKLLLVISRKFLQSRSITSTITALLMISLVYVSLKQFSN